MLRRIAYLSLAVSFVVFGVVADEKKKPATTKATTVATDTATPGQFNCRIVGINAQAGVVSAKVNASEAAFQFRVTDAKLLASLHVGQGVYANFTTKQVSLDGKIICCTITSPPQAPAPVTAPKPVSPHPASAPVTKLAPGASAAAPAAAASVKSTSEAATNGLQRTNAPQLYLPPVVPVPPRIRALTVTSPVTGGDLASCSVQLDAPTNQKLGVVVYLVVQHPLLESTEMPGRRISVPDHVMVRFPFDGVSFGCQTYPVNAPWPQVISAQIGKPFSQGTSQDVTSATLTVLPAALSSLTLTVDPAALSSLSADPGALTGGGHVQGTVQLSGKLAAPWMLGPRTVTPGVVALYSTDPGVVIVPKTIEVGTGNESATFTISTTPVPQTKRVDITASYGIDWKTASLMVLPLLPTAVLLDPPEVNSGSPSKGSVTMSGLAFSSGMDISLTSSNPAAATVPPSVHYSPGGQNPTNGVSAYSDLFTIKTHSVQKTTVDITACSGIPPSCKSAPLTIFVPQAQVGVKEVQISNCHPDQRSVYIWTFDATTNEYVDHGSAPSNWLGGQCPGLGSPFSVSLTSGDQMQIIAVDPAADLCGGLNDAKISACQKLMTQFMTGDSKGTVVQLTIQ